MSDQELEDLLIKAKKTLGEATPWTVYEDGDLETCYLDGFEHGVQYLNFILRGLDALEKASQPLWKENK